MNRSRLMTLCRVSTGPGSTAARLLEASWARLPAFASAELGTRDRPSAFPASPAAARSTRPSVLPLLSSPSPAFPVPRGQRRGRRGARGGGQGGGGSGEGGSPEGGGDRGGWGGERGRAADAPLALSLKTENKHDPPGGGLVSARPLGGPTRPHLPVCSGAQALGPRACSAALLSARSPPEERSSLALAFKTPARVLIGGPA